jgi:hypothetical protein
MARTFRTEAHPNRVRARGPWLCWCGATVPAGVRHVCTGVGAPQPVPPGHGIPMPVAPTRVAVGARRVVAEGT